MDGASGAGQNRKGEIMNIEALDYIRSQDKMIKAATIISNVHCTQEDLDTLVAEGYVNYHINVRMYSAA